MTTPRLSYSVATFAAESGLSPTHIRAEIKAGRLKARMSGVTEDGEPTGKFVILHADAVAYLDGLSAA